MGRRHAVLALILLASCFGLGSSAEPPGAWPGHSWDRAEPSAVGMDTALLVKAREYALKGRGSGVIVRHGRLVMAWGDLKRRYDLKSTTKSIGVTALGLAIGDGKVGLDDAAGKRHPTFALPPEANRATGWIDAITLRHLATQTAGFEKPGGYGKLLFPPGTKWSYSDGGPNWLAECLTLAYRQDLRELMFERVFGPLGVTRDDLTWRENAYRPRELAGVKRREFGSGISANVDAMARIGYLYLRDGRWGKQQIIPRAFVDQLRRPVEGVVGVPEQDAKTYGNASDHYGLLWWNNGDGALPNVPRDAYWSWGLYDSLIVVIPSLDLVVARAGPPPGWQRDWDAQYDVLKPFLKPIAAACQDREIGTPPYPRSELIEQLIWAPPAAIARKAPGSDNWPLTWADDGQLYSAYGDGWGFEPRTREKLSLGFARVDGGPDDFRGINIRSTTGEQKGDGPRGKKASGLLMVDGVLYMWVRNAENSQLAWSQDRGKTWAWANWRFTESFGFPVFLNFGRDYAGAPDRFVYIYSPDHNSAYAAADRLVLARTPRARIRQRSAYEFFAGRDARGRPRWSRRLQDRQAVFRHPRRCYRPSVSYHPALKRYLISQVLPGDDPEAPLGLALYEAPEPWGPWRTVYYTEKWDVDPGEAAHLPLKWASDDGLTLHLVFSGDDSFSVRQAVLRLARKK